MSTIRVCDQPEHCQGARPHDPAVRVRAGGRSDAIVNRRMFVRTFGIGVLASSSAGHSQPTTARPPRIGVLSVNARGNVLAADTFPTVVPYEKLLQGAKEHGYSIGETVLLELRGAQGR